LFLENLSLRSQRRTFREQGFDFYIISPDAIPVILSAFKKITTYELAEKLDPRDREDIVSLIAEFDFHINQRNAIDIIASKMGTSVLSKMENLKKEFRDEVSAQEIKDEATATMIIRDESPYDRPRSSRLSYCRPRATESENYSGIANEPRPSISDPHDGEECPPDGCGGEWEDLSH
jgi:hypothetical protein